VPYFSSDGQQGSSKPNSSQLPDFLSKKQGICPFSAVYVSFLPSVIHVADFLLHGNADLSQGFLLGAERVLFTRIKITGKQILATF
jgi:hypothetical protein